MNEHNKPMLFSQQAGLGKLLAATSWQNTRNFPKLGRWKSPKHGRIEMRVFILLVSCFALFGCNAMVGTQKTMDEEPWRTIYQISAVTILLFPVVSIVALTAIRVIKPAFIKSRAQLQRYSLVLLFVVFCVWLIMEISLPARANIRIDLFVIIPALIAQVIITALSRFFYAQNKNRDF